MGLTVSGHRIRVMVLGMLVSGIGLPVDVSAQETDLDAVRQQAINVDFSFVNTTGNTDTTTTSFGAGYSAQRGRWGFGVEGKHMQFDFGEVTAAESSDVKFHGSRVLNQRLALLVIGGWERDIFKGLDARYVGGGGLLAQLVRLPRWALAATGAAGWTRETLTLSPLASDFLTLFGEVDSTIGLSQTASFTQTLTVRPGFQSANSELGREDATDLLIDFEMALQSAVNSWLSVVLQYTVDHDTEPAFGKEQTDQNVTASLRLGWSRQ